MWNIPMYTADGHIPKYDPKNKEYGCLVNPPPLLYKSKIPVILVHVHSTASSILP